MTGDKDGYRNPGKASDSGTSATPSSSKGGGAAPELTPQQRAHDAFVARNAAQQAQQAAYERAQQDWLMQQQMAQQQQSLLQQYGGPMGAYQAILSRGSLGNIYAPKIQAVPHEGVIAGELIGWRVWEYVNGFLCSMSMDNAWIPGVPMKADKAPDINNHVGVYAFKKPGKELLLSGHILGTVYMWGEVLECQEGYRAEYAMIRSIDSEDSSFPFFWKKEKFVNALRKKYCVGNHFWALENEQRKR